MRTINETRPPVKNSSLEVMDGRDDMPVFIHSELDDYGLSPIEFRVYARLARRAGRGQAREAVTRMARDFEVSDRTIQRALRVLVACDLISEETRPGNTTIYRLNGRRLWQDRKLLKATRARLFPKRPAAGVTSDAAAGGDITAGAVVTPQRGVVVTPQRDEGSPDQGSPAKVLLHTHTRVSPPARASEPPAVVCVCKLPHGSEFCADVRVAYARNKPGTRDPHSYGNSKDMRAGLYDEAVREWLRKVEKPAAARAQRDTSACPDCQGTNFYYPAGDTQEGRTRGTAKCLHPRLDPQSQGRHARSDNAPLHTTSL